MTALLFPMLLCGEVALGDAWKPADGIAPSEAVYLCGRRAAVEAFLGQESAGRTAFSPLDAFNELDVALSPEPRLVRARTAPGAVEREYAFASGGTLHAVWEVDHERPLLRARYRVSAPPDAPLELTCAAQVTSNVGYVNKFVQHDDDTGTAEAYGLRFRDRARPELVLDLEVLGLSDEEPPSAKMLAENRGQIAWQVTVPPNSSRTFGLRVSAATEAAIAEYLGTDHVVPLSPYAEGGFRLESPDAELDAYIRACSWVPLANVRDLPFGPPFGADGTANELWPVLTASPDYHGIFANDCIQSLWELGLLGPSLYEPARNSVETMFHYGSTESVEWWTGDGKVWQFPAPLGNTPQVALGACWHLLWRGDRRLAESWWPRIESLLALHDAHDSDGDELEDRPNTPYPEQPDPGTYNHEMLYVQCFWRQAFHRAAQVAEWLGEPEAGALERKARRISRAIERVFATPYGLAVWVDKDHRPHPHIGHEQIIAAAAGDVPDERARAIVATASSPPIWTLDGPLRAEPGKGVAAGDHVWTFMRWKLVHAMFRLGETDRALELADRWAEQERRLNYQAPEAFPTVTGTTGRLYTWTAGRAIRAVILGLTGLDLTGDGIVFAPRLPSGWDGFAVRSIPLHGTTIDLVVKRGRDRVAIDGRTAATPTLPYARLGRRHHTVEVWCER